LKVAICFFGITRNLRPRTLDAMHAHLFAPAAVLDPHFVRFGHFNVPGWIDNPRTKEDTIPVVGDDFLKLGCDHLVTTPQETVDTQLDLTAFQAHGDPWGDGFVSLRNLFRQYYSLDQVTHLLQASGQRFDVVIYTRADILYRSRVCIPPMEPRVIRTPRFAKWGGLNDRFALGNMETMIEYGLRGRAALDYIEQTDHPLHAEEFLAWYVVRQGLRNEDIDVLFCRIRANGSVAPLDGPWRHLYTLYGMLQRFAQRHPLKGRSSNR
jgi:hypothetical protein